MANALRLRARFDIAMDLLLGSTTHCAELDIGAALRPALADIARPGLGPPLAPTQIKTFLEHR